MWSAILWGAVAAFSLVLGTILAMLRKWSDRLIGLVLAFGAGALIAGISFELYEEAIKTGGPVPVAVGLAVGALTYYTANRIVTGMAAGGGKKMASTTHRAPSRMPTPAADPNTPSGQSGSQGAAGVPMALGALLDGIPEQAVLGIGLAAGGAVNPAMLVAVFVSNLPESVGSSADMMAGGRSKKTVLKLWIVVSLVCTLATVGGFVLADLLGGTASAVINGFAAGALLVMLIDSMAPEAKEKANDVAGLATALGFAVTAALSMAS